MTFNEKKQTHIDKEIFRILDLLEETQKEKSKPSNEGSIAHEIPDDWSDRIIIDKPVIETSALLEKTTAIRECHQGKCIGFNETSYKEFDKFISSIYKEKTVHSVISRKFIEKKTFDWLLVTHKRKQAETNFSSYILTEMQNAIKEYKVHYSILYLTIGGPMQVGKVHFEFFTKEFFDQLIEQFKNRNQGKDNTYESMRKEYQGKVYATYTVSAEREKAKEIALEQCSLSVDVLKMCSDTTHIPQMRLSFDIDSRTKENIKNELILLEPNIPSETFSMDFYRLPSQHKIYKDEWERMLKLGIQTFHNFLLQLSNDPSELEQLIVNGIKRYGNAISNSNTHQRVVELFTILESLLLADKDSAIIESVCKYCSKLIVKNIEERKDVIKLLKTMYAVRSSLIHHAKEIPFDIDNLRKLQHAVILLLYNLIAKSKDHKTKQSVLSEIDEAILRAY